MVQYDLLDDGILRDAGAAATLATLLSLADSQPHFLAERAFVLCRHDDNRSRPLVGSPRGERSGSASETNDPHRRSINLLAFSQVVWTTSLAQLCSSSTALFPRTSLRRRNLRWGVLLRGDKPARSVLPAGPRRDQACPRAYLPSHGTAFLCPALGNLQSTVCALTLACRNATTRGREESRLEACSESEASRLVHSGRREREQQPCRLRCSVRGFRRLAPSHAALLVRRPCARSLRDEARLDWFAQLVRSPPSCLTACVHSDTLQCFVHAHPRHSLPHPTPTHRTLAASTNLARQNKPADSPTRCVASRAACRRTLYN